MQISEELFINPDIFFQHFILGQIMARMDKVHDHLIQGEHKEALASMNDAMRYANEQIHKIYDISNKEVK